MSQTPERGWERREPPPGLKTAVGTGGGDGRVLALCLADEHESAAVELALAELGWEVEVGYGPFDALDVLEFGEDRPDVIFTDDPGILREWTEGRPTVAVVVDRREDAVVGAWQAGADWVVTRPLNPVNPLRPV